MKGNYRDTTQRQQGSMGPRNQEGNMTSLNTGFFVCVKIWVCVSGDNFQLMFLLKSLK